MIRTKEHADKVARHINEFLEDGQFVIVAGERIEKRNGCLYLPARKAGQMTPVEIGEFVIWPNRKEWNKELATAKAKSLLTWPNI